MSGNTQIYAHSKGQTGSLTHSHVFGSNMILPAASRSSTNTEDREIYRRSVIPTVIKVQVCEENRPNVTSSVKISAVLGRPRVTGMQSLWVPDCLWAPAQFALARCRCGWVVHGDFIPRPPLTAVSGVSASDQLLKRSAPLRCPQRNVAPIMRARTLVPPGAEAASPSSPSSHLLHGRSNRSVGA